MDIDNIDFNNQLHQMKKEIDYYKSKLQNCRDKYESIETKICNARQLQRKTLFVLDNTQLEEENLHENLKSIYLNYKTCVEKSNSSEDLNEIICAKIRELTIQRNTLMQELKQLKQNADDNDKKLARVNAMITEQEEKNATLFYELKEKSENVSLIPQDIKKRIDTTLEHLKISDSDNPTDYTIQ